MNKIGPTVNNSQDTGIKMWIRGIFFSLVNILALSTAIIDIMPRLPHIIPQPKFVVIEGDVYIVAVFALTEEGCTGIRTNSGYQYTDAVAFALKKVNRQKGQFAELDVKIGAIIMDDCKDAERGTQMVKEFLRGYIKINDPTGKPINSSLVVGVVGSSNSDKTIQLADYLKTEKTALVAPFASSPKLSNRTRFPYFVRTIPSDDKQGPALAAMLIRVGWFNVHVIIEDGSTYASDLEMQFRTEFLREGGCISTSHFLQIQSNSSNAEAIILAIAGNTSKTDVVLVLGRLNVLRSILEAKKSHITDKKVKRLVFVGSETWGKSEHVVQGHEDAAKGSISVSLYGENVAAFDAFMATLRYGCCPSNPFFNKYFEAMHKCQNTTCPTKGSVTELEEYSQSTYVKHVINAVYALSIATMKRLTEKCGSRAMAVCPEFGTAFGEEIIQTMGNMSFKDVNGQNFEIRDWESVNGYDIFYWKADGTPRKIGELTSKGASLENNAKCFPDGNFYDNDSMPESKCPNSEYYCKKCKHGTNLFSKCKGCKQRKMEGYQKCVTCVIHGKCKYKCFNCMK
ncbi:unnamed protein product [Owenia fusiformis]|uniref:Receptor ligand binding region domain-containing protein n=1 Tax=Owenia fusiformis TaxID=6347 RepID=A0A8S4PCL2_OWEFU|nr:unnamed protein product [Owenia fusiformis]